MFGVFGLGPQEIVVLLVLAAFLGIGAIALVVVLVLTRAQKQGAGGVSA